MACENLAERREAAKAKARRARAMRSLNPRIIPSGSRVCQIGHCRLDAVVEIDSTVGRGRLHVCQHHAYKSARWVEIGEGTP